MTYEEIAAMPAGPELDRLACMGAGIEGQELWRVRQADGSEYLGGFISESNANHYLSMEGLDNGYTEQYVCFEPISTSAEAAIAAYEKCKSAEVLSQRHLQSGEIYWCCRIFTPDFAKGYGPTLPLAIARALAWRACLEGKASAHAAERG